MIDGSKDIGASRKIVLLVGQDKEFIRETRPFLKSCGYQIKTTSSGKKALEKIISEDPQIVLLNENVLDLPKGDLIKRIKKIDQNIAVIVTGNDGIEERINLKRLGVEWISKPIESRNLLSILKKVEDNPNIEEGKNSGMDSLLEKFLPFWAHEIRNPLQAIGGAMAIIERRSNIEDKALVQSINIVKEEIQTLSDFVQECLDYVKPPNRSHWGEININETLLLVLNLMPYLFKNHFEQVSVMTNLDPQLPKVYANYEEIKKVFLNILKNGFEAMIKTDKKEMTLTTVSKVNKKNKDIAIIFSDTGEGIKKEHIGSIGTPFFTTKLRGTGMGLVICNKIIVERHNGRLSIEGHENRGTTVTVTLPINQAKENAGE